MAANTTPIFSLTPIVGILPLQGADATTDGTDADVGLAYTAGAFGSYVNKMILQPRGTSGTPATFPAGVFRLYLNNGATVATGTNNSLIREYLMPVATSNLDADTTTLVNYPVELILNFQLPATYRLYCGYTGALTSVILLQVTTFGGDY